ncbi:branched-chain amino acid ABC transporter permease [Deferribacter autotrophicus]|uniref:Branched-chain amino acid ABC transporter permease n=1 Tax=Deferribacter autotrophicus TaxID=500465 RepID=A0A5A8F8W5_9BACT|nr:branched-chain amino acid ABC transporter permease [Deferribacter autotrophicus]KAA0259361.1 branched-chain amino acid ABC transporter permease [Deferribacter autotrophicus]
MKKKYLIILFLLVVGILPVFLPTFWVMIFSEILIMGLFAMSFNLLMGYSGLLSFGHAAFFGIGAYTTAFLLNSDFSSLLMVLLICMIISAVFALFFGLLSIRHDEIFFAMITLGLGMMIFTFAHNYREITGGSDGLPIMNIPDIKIMSYEITLFSPVNMYLFVLFITVIFILIMWKVVNSSFGLLLKGMRENKNRLYYVGGNIAKIRLIMFVISGTIAGACGFLFSLFSSMATPDFLHWSFSAKPVIMTILGGSTVFLGPLGGAALFFILEQIILRFTENWMFFLGTILIPIVLFFPKGVFGTIYEYITRK